MKITGRQLRQIIKEELARKAVNEEDPFEKLGREVGSETAARGAAALRSIEAAEASRRSPESLVPDPGGYDAAMAQGAAGAAATIADLEKAGILTADPSAALTKTPSMGTPEERVASAIESRLTIDDPDTAVLAGRPQTQAALKLIAGGRASVKMGSRMHPVVSVIKAAMQSALDELRDMLIAKGATTSAGGATIGVKAIITKILLDDTVDASMLKYACAAAMSNLGAGSSGGVPSQRFDEDASEAAILIQHLAGLKTDGNVGKATLAAIARPNIAITV